MLATLATVLLAQSYYTPQEAQALYAQANDAFYRTPPDYEAARKGYLQLIKHGNSGPDVLFNLGTTCLAAGNLGEAVLYLERAHRLQRSDDIEANLSIARERQGDQVVGQGAAEEPFIQRLAEAVNEAVVSWACLGALWLGFGLVLWFRWLTPGRRLWVGLAAALCLLSAAGTGGIVAVHVYVARSIVEAVVMPPTATVREFPGTTSRVAFEVHAGLKVRVMEESGKFVRIRLPNNLEGWTEREGVVAL
jgi:hypothetical protein